MALEIVVITTTRAASDDKVAIMKIRSFQWDIFRFSPLDTANVVSMTTPLKTNTQGLIECVKYTVLHYIFPKPYNDELIFDRKCWI